MKKNILMWVGILVMGALLLISLMFLSGRICHFELWKRCFGEGRAAFFYAVLLVLVVLAALWVTLGYVDAIVCLLHALVFWSLCDGAAWLLQRLSGTEIAHNLPDVVALVLTLAWLSYGWYNAHHVCRTAYTLSGGVSESVRIVGFSDSHVGAVFSGKDFRKYVERMNAEEADAVVIVGDFVDDETSRENMEQACTALSKLKTKCGVYYVFGNHDIGYYNSRRGYGKEELMEQLQANGVRILEDETVPLRGNVKLCGRKDAHSERKSASELTGTLTDGDYMIMLNHQPTDYAAETEAGVGLVLSGHTHGGQLIPIRKLIGVLGKNNRVYGHEKRGDTDFIVSSGIGDWALDFKTGCISEYFVVDIQPE